MRLDLWQQIYLPLTVDITCKNTQKSCVVYPFWSHGTGRYGVKTPSHTWKITISVMALSFQIFKKWWNNKIRAVIRAVCLTILCAWLLNKTLENVEFFSKRAIILSKSMLELSALDGDLLLYAQISVWKFNIFPSVVFAFKNSNKIKLVAFDL
jgi:hypothetical protein